MNGLAKILSWVMALVIFFIALIATTYMWWGASIPLFVAALLFVPAISGYLKNSLNLRIGVLGRVVITIAAFFIAIFLNLHNISLEGERAIERQALEQREKQLAALEQKRSYFSENRDSIVSSIQASIDSSNFESASKKINEYAFLGDPALSDLKDELAAAKKEEARKELTTQLSELSPFQHQERIKLLEALADEFPEQAEYKENLQKEVELNNKALTEELLTELATLSESEHNEKAVLYSRLSEINPGVDEYKELAEKNLKAAEDLRAEVRANELLALAKGIPVEHSKDNLEVYKELLELNPENERFSEKVSFYQEKVDEALAVEKERQKLEQLRNSGYGWVYRTYEDQVSGKSASTVSVKSINVINMDFPYRGNQRGTLQLRKHPRYGYDAILSIEKGQFVCATSGCTIQVRFDEGDPVRFNAVEPDDHSSTTIFLKDYNGFVQRMKKAQQIYVGATFYQEGTKVFHFLVEEFKEL